MKIRVSKATVKDIQPLRTLFLQEFNRQFIHHSFHERGWTDEYIFTKEEIPIGYGSVCGSDRKLRDSIFEFYIVPSCRKFASKLFQQLIAMAAPHFVSCQTNDVLLTSMLFEFAKNISGQAVLFEDHVQTEYFPDGVTFRTRNEDDKLFRHTSEPEGDFVLETNGEVIATGGFLLHYNPPFADLYMEVKEGFRGKGLASFLLQEIKKRCYDAGRVPAARCNIGNKASNAALIKAGLRPCGFMVTGEIKDLTQT